MLKHENTDVCRTCGTADAGVFCWGEGCRACRKCTSQQILDTNHKKIYNKKLSVSQISVRNATCDIELESDSLTNKLDAVH